MSVKPLRASAFCVLAILVTACGGTAGSIRPTTTTTTTTRPLAAASLQQVVTAGQLSFRIPSSWTVGHGVCRCGWGEPSTATLDNGPLRGGVACNCPMESSDAPSGLHLYEGQTGLVSGGSPTVIHGLRALVGLDTSNATLTVTFPGIDQWMTISPAPLPRNPSSRLEQLVLEKQILATVQGRP
jgi:hypothetical protein